ncbi:hypothetical protein PMAYCL1PPCAC_21864, partial [Pristionchus mayeri]
TRGNGDHPGRNYNYPEKKPASSAEQDSKMDAKKVVIVVGSVIVGLCVVACIATAICISIGNRRIYQRRNAKPIDNPDANNNS